ncbi:hypothetical protein AVEN_81424-1 [Araneus ventricosus]|uniref:Uncharacterized protein n=1 Tax=Araneus ventricosus TaxID=182803 RepID=A0A4Y2P166_ARAVE|nr:hypothetical protein AVEN_81424-1 [Araneus ventricosus]
MTVLGFLLKPGRVERSQKQSLGIGKSVLKSENSTAVMRLRWTVVGFLIETWKNWKDLEEANSLLEELARIKYWKIRKLDGRYETAMDGCWISN